MEPWKDIFAISTWKGMIALDNSNTLSEEELEKLLAELPIILHELEMDASQEAR